MGAGYGGWRIGVDREGVRKRVKGWSRLREEIQTIRNEHPV